MLIIPVPFSLLQDFLWAEDEQGMHVAIPL
jgi:hypothetical protein